MAIIMDELTPASQMNTNFPAFLRDFGPTLGQAKMYLWLCKQGINGMKTFFKAILDNSVRTIFPLAFHCATGKDRTGMVAMIFGLLTSARDEEICNDYFETQKYMEDNRNKTSICVLLDKSGSMDGYPLENAKKVIKHMVQYVLCPNDFFSLITFDSTCNLVINKMMIGGNLEHILTEISMSVKWGSTQAYF